MDVFILHMVQMCTSKWNSIGQSTQTKLWSAVGNSKLRVVIDIA